MNRSLAVALPVLLAALAITPAAQGDPLSPIHGVAHRPAVRLETDYYVYGPGTGFTNPVLSVDLDPNGYPDPVTLFLYWQDREGGDGTRQYFNVHGGFGAAPDDLLSAGAQPAKIFAPALEGFEFFGPGGAFGPMPNEIPSSTGRYMFVFEIRDAAGTNVISRSVAMYNEVDGVVSRSGSIAADQTWTKNNLYRLAAPVNVQSGATLTIEPGTVVIGSKGGQGTLIGLRASQIVADGTLWNPIVLTSEFPVGERAPGDWGGVVMSGDAPANCQQTAAGCAGEGNSGNFGGDNPNGSCGTLRYVRVEFAGIRFSEQNELNGIALQGCGSATVVEKVEVLWNKDDGLEFFGGTANAKYVLVVDAEDDNLDWVNGWIGKVQFMVAIQRHGLGNNGIEADNLDVSNDILPRSNPTVANITFIGNRNVGPGEPGDGMLLRRGTAGTINNFIMQSFPVNGVSVVNTATEALLGTTLNFQGGMLFDNGVPGEDAGTLAYIADPANKIRTDSPNLQNPQSLIQPDIAPLGGSPARNAANAVPTPGDPFFDAAPFLGGVNPQSNWTFEGWITFADN